MLLDVAAVVLSDLVAIVRAVAMVVCILVIPFLDCKAVRKVRILGNQFLDYTVARKVCIPVNLFLDYKVVRKVRMVENPVDIPLGEEMVPLLPLAILAYHTAYYTSVQMDFAQMDWTCPMVEQMVLVQRWWLVAMDLTIHMHHPLPLAQRRLFP